MTRWNTADDVWRRVDRKEPTECWEWIGKQYRDGYGQCHWASKQQQAHRVVWTIANGPIPNGLFVCHRCDNRSCCNPAHLFLGTHQDNMRDRNSKQRTARGPRSPAALHPDRIVRGEANSNARLTVDDVLAIRAAPGSSAAELAPLAQRFGVSLSHIQKIRYGRAWRHLVRKP